MIIPLLVTGLTVPLGGRHWVSGVELCWYVQEHTPKWELPYTLQVRVYGGNSQGVGWRAWHPLTELCVGPGLQPWWCAWACPGRAGVQCKTAGTLGSAVDILHCLVVLLLSRDVQHAV